MMRSDSHCGDDRISCLGAERHAGIDTGSTQSSHSVFVFKRVCKSSD